MAWIVTVQASQRLGATWLTATVAAYVFVVAAVHALARHAAVIDTARLHRGLAGVAALFAKLGLLTVVATCLPGRQARTVQAGLAALTGLVMTAMVLPAAWCWRRVAKRPAVHGGTAAALSSDSPS
jgi:hypothetical protein